MHVAVTGAAGHLGSNLCRALLARGDAVSVLCHRRVETLEGLEVRFVTGDVRRLEDLLALCDGAEVVVHLAAKISIEGDPDGSVWDVNVNGTRCVVEACRRAGVRRLVHVSSIHALRQAPRDEPLDEARALVGEDAFAYDRSKAEGERVVLEGVARGLDAVIVNPTAVLGPIDPEPSLMGRALLDLYHGRLPCLVPGGFDWVDVRDVVDALLQAAERGRCGARYLASGTYETMAGLAARAAAVTGRPAPRLTVPLWVARLGLPPVRLYSRLSGTRPLYTGESLEILQTCNPRIRHDRAARELGYAPRPLEATLRDTYAWFRETGRLA